MCGSIVPDDFEWAHYKHRLSVDASGDWQALNDCGMRDIWPVLAKSVTWGYGSSGRFGFGHARVKDRYFDAAHSGFFHHEFVRDLWLPYLSRGEIIEGALERATTPWWVSVLTVAKLRYIIVALLCMAVWLSLPMLRPTENLQSQRVAAANFVRAMTPQQQQGLAAALGKPNGADALANVLDSIGAADTPERLDRIAQTIKLLFGKDILNPSDNERPDGLIGKTGWIYVGTRVGGRWGKTEAEGIEPAFTLNVLDDIPKNGSIYTVIHPVTLRVSLPQQSSLGARPPMPNAAGEFRKGIRLKVDQVQQLLLRDPDRIWVWAHVTVVK
jgi:hypothetical protein